MYKDQITAKLDEVISYKQEFGENTEKGYLNKITSPLIDLEDHLREQIQSEPKGKYQKNGESYK